MKMSKLSKKVLMSALVSATILSGTGLKAFATEEIMGAEVINCTDEYCGDFSMEGYIKGLDMLTESEKKILLDTEKSLESTYKKMDALYEKISERYDGVYEDNKEIFDRYDKLYEKNSKLWDKLYSNMTDEQFEIEDSIEQINSSKVLSKSEKKILIEDQKKLDVINSQITKIYEKIDESCKDIYEEIDRIAVDVDKAYEKNRSIWDKVYPESEEELIEADLND